MNKALCAILGIGLAVSILFIPIDLIPITGITLVEKRLLAILFFAVWFWVFEPIPIFSTSVCIITLELLLISDKSFIWLRNHQDTEVLGTLMPYKDIFHTFASPIILLFLGGFFLAMAATKYRLDINLARVLLKPFGKKPSMVILGVMAITAVFSMFMSNTATTAMMLAILMPILSVFEINDPARVGMTLSVPFAANIGGLGTPIGTPPNAVAMKYLTGEMSVNFGEWMVFALPFVLILLAAAWAILLFFFPPKVKELQLKIDGKFLLSTKAIVVYITFLMTLLLWIFGSSIGLNSYVVALIPVAVFTSTGIITAVDMRKMSWDVLWLVSGGIALGIGLSETGLSAHLIQSIPFAEFNPWFIALCAVLLSVVMATFMSNTATANLILPIVAALGTTLATLEPIGGAKMLIITCAFGCSLAMALPVSTPPNAMAYATGMIDAKAMMKSGIVINTIGFLMVFVMVFILRAAGFFG